MDSFGGWLTLILLLLFGWMVAAASGYPADARLMPVAIGLVGAALCLLQITLDLGNARRKRLLTRFHPAPKVGRPELHDEGTTGLGPQTRSAEIVMWSYFLAFIAALLAFGFYVAIPAMLFFCLWRQAGTKPTVAAAAAAAAGATMFAVFAKLFGFVLFPGAVWSAILKLSIGG
jgi:hypothetical protein